MTIVGRHQEWGEAEQLLTGLVVARAGGLLLLEGEAGIGKTTMLRALVDEARARGVRSLAGSASGLDRFRPFGPVLDAFGVTASDVPAGAPEGELERVRAIFAGGPAGETERVSPLQTGTDERGLLIESLVSLAEAWCTDQPLLVIIDDLHAADPATLSTVLRLTRLAAQHPFLLAGALRPRPRSSEVDEVRRAVRDNGTVIDLGPLDDSAVCALLTELADAQPGDDLLRLSSGAAGNAFLLTELVDTLRREHRLEIEDGEAIVRAAADATFDGAAIVSRMAELSDEARDAARVAALLGSSFRAGDLAAVLDGSPSSIASTVDALHGSGLLESDGEVLRFRHDLVREAIEREIPAAVRAALHLEIGRCLSNAGAPPTQVAAHYMAGAQPGDRAAVDVLRSAAAQIMGSGPAAAADLLARAVELTLATDPGRTELVATLVDAYAWSGQNALAVELSEDALALPVPADLASRLHETAARSLAVLGRPAEAVAHAAAAGGPGRDAWASALAAAFRVFALDLDGAIADGERTLLLVEEQPDVWAEALANVAIGWVDNVRGYFTAAAERFERSVRLADEAPGREPHRLLPHLFRSFAYVNAGRWREAEASIRAGRELVDQLGTVWALPFYHYAAGQAQWTRGELDDLLSECNAGLQCASDHNAWLAAPWAYATSAAAHLYQGRLDEADEALTAGEDLLASGGIQYGLDWLVWVRGLWLEATGDPEAARSALGVAWEMASGLQASAALALVGPDLIRMAVLDGDVSKAKSLLDALAGDGNERTSVDVLLLRCRGLVKGDASLVMRARELHADQGRRLEVVLDEEALALTLFAVGTRKHAQAQLARCVDACNEVGAGMVADRVMVAAEAAGITTRRTTKLRESVGWDALTSTEQRVAELVAAGHSNPEIAVHLDISRRTVEAHLYRIFPKLDVRNRTALALWLVSREPARSSAMN